MPQELHFSLSSKSARIVRANICKIAFRTIPRCGIAALILLCLGFYFLFPACQTFQQIQTEKNTSYELTAATDNSIIDLNSLVQIEGVERISPVLNLSANLSADDFKLDCSVKAVYSSFLDLQFTEGAMYPDSSNTPYLILNEAAAKSFALDYQTVTVSAEDTVMMNANGAERKAIICGIFDDGNNTPTAYMSYDVAQKEYGQTGQTELIFLLEDKGAAEEVVSTLQRQNIYSSFDSGITLAWELLQKQCWQTALLSIGLLACAAVLFREKRSVETHTRHCETAMLLLSGMTANDCEKVYPLRVAMTGLLSMLIASTSAIILGSFSFFSIGVSVCTLLIHMFVIII